MSKAAALIFVGTGAAIGLAALGYSSGLLTAMPAGRPDPAITSQQSPQKPETCGSREVVRTVETLVKGMAASTRLFLEVSQSRAQEFDKELTAADNAEISKAESDCPSENMGAQRDQCLGVVHEKRSADFLAGMAKVRVLREQLASQVQFSLENIRTSTVDKDVGAASCSADIKARLGQDEAVSQSGIAYKIEKTTDGKLYITLTNPDQL